MVRRKLFLVLFSMLFLFLRHNKIFAQKNFSTSIISTYTVLPDKTTKIDQRITLRNNSDEYFPKEYNMLIATDNIDSIRARDSKGNILKDYRKFDNLTQISLIFNDKLIGKGKQLKFRVSYKSKELSIKKGNGWQIYIPATPESNNIEKYTAILKVPKNFPEKVKFSIKPLISRNRKYIWTKEQLKNASASAFFSFSSQNRTGNSANKEYKSKLGGALPIFLFIAVLVFSFYVIFYKKNSG